MKDFVRKRLRMYNVQILTTENYRESGSIEIHCNFMTAVHNKQKKIDISNNTRAIN